MPTYEYRCDNCAKNFDVVQSFTDDPLTECPTCGSPVRKVFGSVGIVFKGSGFYKTDSRSGGGTASVPSESSSSSTASGDSGSGKDSGSDSGSSGKDSGSKESSSPASSSDKPAAAPATTPSASKGSSPAK